MGWQQSIIQRGEPDSRPFTLMRVWNSPPMRLLNVTQSYYPFFDQGGPTVKVRALARGMAASGHEVTVLTADLGFDPAKQKIAQATASRWGFEAKEDGVE